MIVIEQDKDLSGRKLTTKMEEALRRVVATSGGGLSGYEYSQSVYRGLIRRGLVQGKAGQPHRVVHTKAGLDYVRNLNTPTEGD